MVHFLESEYAQPLARLQLTLKQLTSQGINQDRFDSNTDTPRTVTEVAPCQLIQIFSRVLRKFYCQIKFTLKPSENTFNLTVYYCLNRSIGTNEIENYKAFLKLMEKGGLAELVAEERCDNLAKTALKFRVRKFRRGNWIGPF